MQPISNVILTLSDEEARSFVLFQKHRFLIKLLEEAGFFNMKDGQVTIHKDKFGSVRKVDISTYLHYD